MGTSFSEEHRMLQQSVRQFARDQLAPKAAKLDEVEGFNEDAFRRMGDLGVLGITASEEFGGTDMGWTAATIVMEEFGAVCASTALSYLAHSILCVNNIYTNGNTEQKKRYLPKLISGTAIGAMAMTEPGAGSDAVGMRTTATKKGDRYILRGSKTFITNGPVADTFVVYARTGQQKKDLSTFIVEKGAKGFHIAKKLSKLGMRASPTAELSFDDVEVPVENRVGEEGQCVAHMMRNLNVERITIAGISLGLHRAAVEAATQYSTDRKQFEKPIAEFQMVQKLLADMACSYEAANAFVYKAAAQADDGKTDDYYLGSGAKLFAAEAATKACMDAIQVLGGYGYIREYPVERYMRDAKLMEIGAGTSEVMRVIIARELLKRFHYNLK
jgi:isovaleryl-CoA dehydrogenase